MQIVVINKYLVMCVYKIVFNPNYLKQVQNENNACRLGRRKGQPFFSRI